MPELKNPKHERMAQFLAQGMSQVDAHEEAGYKRNDSNAAKMANDPDIRARVTEITGKGAELAAVTVASLLAEAEEARQEAKNAETPQCSAMVAATKFKAEISGLMPDQRAQITNNAQVNILGDNDAARRIGYVLAKQLMLMQQKQIEGKVEEEGK
jgi:hypothetical protein